MSQWVQDVDCRYRDFFFKCIIVGLFLFIWLFFIESFKWEYMFIKVFDCEMVSGFYFVNVQVRDQLVCVMFEGGVFLFVKYVFLVEDVFGGGV